MRMEYFVSTWSRINDHFNSFSLKFYAFWNILINEGARFSFNSLLFSFWLDIRKIVEYWPMMISSREQSSLLGKQRSNIRKQHFSQLKTNRLVEFKIKFKLEQSFATVYLPSNRTLNFQQILSLKTGGLWQKKWHLFSTSECLYFVIHP